VQAYDQYVFERGSIPGTDDSDFVLINLFRGQIGAPMLPGAVNDLITSLASRAGLSRQVTPHMLRHAAGSNLMDTGASLDEVQDILGHASLSSTGVYIHPDSVRLRAAVDRVPSPRLTSEKAAR
jgi:integrase/recombinase XerD